MATLRQLQTFVTVAEYRKMNEAAKRLFISQPTVSQMISALEDEYDVILFERKSNELLITPAGRLLLSSAQEILALSEQLEQNMRNLKSKRPLRAGASLTVGNTMMSTLVTTLTAQYPDIDTTVFVDNTSILEHRLIHNELDIALVEGIIMREEIITEPILHDSLKIICGNNSPFFHRDIVKIEELAKQEFIMREKGSGTRAIFENIMLSNHIPFTTKWECSSGTAIIDAVRHNLGLGILSERCIQDAAAKGEIHGFDIDGVSLKRFFYICFNKKHPVSTQMKDFIAIARTMQDMNNCNS